MSPEPRRRGRERSGGFGGVMRLADGPRDFHAASRRDFDAVWENHTYYCGVVGIRLQGSAGDHGRLLRELMDATVHLMIERRDRRPVTGWDHLQRIKNEVVGDRRQAIEFHPPQPLVHDRANMRHLWVMPEGSCVFSELDMAQLFNADGMARMRPDETRLRGIFERIGLEYPAEA